MMDAASIALFSLHELQNIPELFAWGEDLAQPEGLRGRSKMWTGPKIENA
jgi:hypothetical protein